MVYDQSIGAGGLRWCELQAWWKDTRQITDDEAKKTLYGRLISSLPDNSPRSGTCSPSTITSTPPLCATSWRSCPRNGQPQSSAIACSAARVPMAPDLLLYARSGRAAPSHNDNVLITSSSGVFAERD
jgi:hypothetical protein